MVSDGKRNSGGLRRAGDLGFGMKVAACKFYRTPKARPDRTSGSRLKNDFYMTALKPSGIPLN